VPLLCGCDWLGSGQLVLRGFYQLDRGSGILDMDGVRDQVVPHILLGTPRRQRERPGNSATELTSSWLSPREGTFQAHPGYPGLDAPLSTHAPTYELGAIQIPISN